MSKAQLKIDNAANQADVQALIQERALRQEADNSVPVVHVVFKNKANLLRRLRVCFSLVDVSHEELLQQLLITLLRQVERSDSYNDIDEEVGVAGNYVQPRK